MSVEEKEVDAASSDIPKVDLPTETKAAASASISAESAKSDLVQAAVKDFSEGKISLDEFEAVVKLVDDKIAEEKAEAERKIKKAKSEADLKKQEEIDNLSLAAAVGGAVVGIVPGLYMLAMAGLAFPGVQIGMAVSAIVAYTGAKQENELGAVVRNTVGAPTQGFFLSTKKRVQDSIENSTNASKKKVSETLSAIAATPGNIVKAVTAKINEAVDNIVATPGRIADSTKIQVDKTVAEISALPEKTAVAIKSTVDKQVDITQKTIKKTSDEIVAIPGKVSASVQQAADSVAQTAKKSADSVADSVKKSADSFVESVQKGADSVTESVQKSVGSVEKSMSDMVDKASGLFSSPSPSSASSKLATPATQIPPVAPKPPVLSKPDAGPTLKPKLEAIVEKQPIAAKVEVPISLDKVLGQFSTPAPVPVSKAKIEPAVEKKAPSPKVEALNEVSLRALFGRSNDEKPAQKPKTPPSKPTPVVVQLKDTVEPPAMALNEVSLGALFGQSRSQAPAAKEKTLPPKPTPAVVQNKDTVELQAKAVSPPPSAPLQRKDSAPLFDLFGTQSQTQQKSPSISPRPQADKPLSKIESSTPVQQKVSKLVSSEVKSVSSPGSFSLGSLFGDLPRTAPEPRVAPSAVKKEVAKIKVEPVKKSTSPSTSFPTFFGESAQPVVPKLAPLSKPVAGIPAVRKQPESPKVAPTAVKREVVTTRVEPAKKSTSPSPSFPMFFGESTKPVVPKLAPASKPATQPAVQKQPESPQAAAMKKAPEEAAQSGFFSLFSAKAPAKEKTPRKSDMPALQDGFVFSIAGVTSRTQTKIIENKKQLYINGGTNARGFYDTVVASCRKVGADIDTALESLLPTLPLEKQKQLKQIVAGLSVPQIATKMPDPKKTATLSPTIISKEVTPVRAAVSKPAVSADVLKETPEESAQTGFFSFFSIKTPEKEKEVQKIDRPTIIPEQKEVTPVKVVVPKPAVSVAAPREITGKPAQSGLFSMFSFKVSAEEKKTIEKTDTKPLLQDNFVFTIAGVTSRTQTKIIENKKQLYINGGTNARGFYDTVIASCRKVGADVDTALESIIPTLPLEKQRQLVQISKGLTAQVPLSTKVPEQKKTVASVRKTKEESDQSGGFSLFSLGAPEKESAPQKKPVLREPFIMPKKAEVKPVLQESFVPTPKQDTNAWLQDGFVFTVAGVKSRTQTIMIENRKNLYINGGTNARGFYDTIVTSCGKVGADVNTALESLLPTLPLEKQQQLRQIAAGVVLPSTKKTDQKKTVVLSPTVDLKEPTPVKVAVAKPAIAKPVQKSREESTQTGFFSFFSSGVSDNESSSQKKPVIKDSVITPRKAEVKPMLQESFVPPARKEDTKAWLQDGFVFTIAGVKSRTQTIFIENRKQLYKNGGINARGFYDAVVSSCGKVGADASVAIESILPTLPLEKRKQLEQIVEALQK